MWRRRARNYFWLWLFVVGVVAAFSFLGLQSTSIYGGDAGDLVSSAFVCGVPHPPGYPFYTFLGCLISKVPISTVAYRLGFLSSVSAVATILVLYLYLLRILKNYLVAAIGSVTYSFIYLIWLYGVIPEVFALHNLFVVLIVYFAYLAVYSNKKYFIFVLFVFGLALTHQQTILFLVPGLVYWVYINRKKILEKKTGIRDYFYFGSCFALGLLFYLYIPLSASRQPPIDWNNAITINRFIRLVTRADYGTFSAGSFVINAPFARLFQFRAYFGSLVAELSYFVMGLVGVGMIVQFIKRRKLFIFHFLLFCFVGPLFVFYAAFPLGYEFGVGTYERFLLPSFPFLVIWVCEAVNYLATLLSSFIVRFAKNLDTRLVRSMVAVVFLVVPYSLFSVNYPRISSLKDDKTAENLAYDILDTVPNNSILILSGDTPLFNTQYVFYSTGYRGDVKLLHHSKLLSSYYQDTLRTYYSDLYLPAFDENYMPAFFEKNSALFPIYSMAVVSGSGGFWSKEGLLYRYYKNESEIPTEKEIVRKNEELWSGYHDPTLGALGSYNHLMLGDVKTTYTTGLKDFAQALFRVQLYSDSYKFLEKAIKYSPRDGQAYYLLGHAYYKKDECEKAEYFFQQAIMVDEYSLDTYKDLIDLYRTCFKDSEKAMFYEKILEKKKQLFDQPLEEL